MLWKATLLHYVPSEKARKSSHENGKGTEHDPDAIKNLRYLWKASVLSGI
jgi:hypothetical protein